MARGRAAKEGDEYWSANGYHYTRTKEKWRLTHHIIAEDKILGRSLREDERVSFKNGDRRDLRPQNIIVSAKRTKEKSLAAREAELEARIEELQAELEEVREQLKQENQKASSA